MSIINEALKKAEKERQSSPELPLAALPQIEGKQAKKDLKSQALNKQLISAGIICALGIILAAAFWQGPTKKPQGQLAQAPRPEPAKQPAAPKVEAKQDAPLVKSQPITIVPVIKPANKPANFVLNGILYDSQKPLAIINGRIFSPGSLIDGARLMEIQPNWVRLSVNGREITLTID